MLILQVKVNFERKSIPRINTRCQSNGNQADKQKGEREFEGEFHVW